MSRFEVTLDDAINGVVYIDADGAFTRPTPPAPDAPPQQFTAWLRENAAFHDRIASSSARAFNHVFRASMKR